MKEQAIVSKKLKEDLYQVVLQKSGSCGSCKGCSLGQDSDLQELILKARGNKEYLPGETVTIEMQGLPILKAAFFLYLLPLILFILGTLIADLILEDNVSVIIGLIMMTAGIIFAKRFDRSESARIHHIVD